MTADPQCPPHNAVAVQRSVGKVGTAYCSACPEIRDRVILAAIRDSGEREMRQNQI